MNHMFSHYCGWLRNPAPVDRWFVPLFTGFQPSKVAQDFATIHSINHYESLFAISPFNHYRNHFLEITSYNSIEISCFPHSLCIKSHRNHWNHQFFSHEPPRIWWAIYLPIPCWKRLPRDVWRPWRGVPYLRAISASRTKPRDGMGLSWHSEGRHVFRKKNRLTTTISIHIKYPLVN